MIGYYYCSVDTFLNIIKKREIYLSDPLKMNDSLEIIWYLNRLYKDKEDRKDFCPYPDYAELDRILSRSQADITFEELMDYIENVGQRNIYISCFSKKSDVLSQWRAYAKDGCGVSLGFELSNLEIADNIFHRDIVYSLDVYGKNAYTDDRETDMEVAADGVSMVLTDRNIEEKTERIKIFLDELIPEFAGYKNPAFKEEDEVRLIYCENMHQEEMLDKYHAWTDKSYHLKKIQLEHDFRAVGNNDITEFVKLPFEPTAIKEIWIGPKCRIRESDIMSLTSRLEYENTDIKIYKSKASYR